MEGIICQEEEDFFFVDQADCKALIINEASDPIWELIKDAVGKRIEATLEGPLEDWFPVFKKRLKITNFSFL